jgi:hypothetical protein
MLDYNDSDGRVKPVEEPKSRDGISTQRHKDTRNPENQDLPPTTPRLPAENLENPDSPQSHKGTKGIRRIRFNRKTPRSKNEEPETRNQERFQAGLTWAAFGV